MKEPQIILSEYKINKIITKFKNIENKTNKALKTIFENDSKRMEYLFFLQTEIIHILQLLNIHNIEITFTNCQKKQLKEIIRNNIFELLRHHLIYSYLKDKNLFLPVLKLIFNFLREAQKNKEFLILDTNFFLTITKELEVLYREPIIALKESKHI